MLSKLNIFYLYLMIAAFPILSLVFSGLSNSQIFTIPFRYFFLVYSIVILGLNISKRKLKRGKLFNILILFWIIYYTRMYYDIYVLNIYLPPGTGWMTYIGFSFGTIVLPVFIIQYLTLNEIKIFSKNLFYIIFIWGTISLSYGISNVYFTGRGYGGLAFGSIIYGQFGALLILLSIDKLLLKNKLLKKVLPLIGVIIGLLIIGVAAAKSPIITLLFSLLIFLISKIEFKRVFSILLLLFVVYQTLGLLLNYFYTWGSKIEGRFIHFLEKGDENRELLWNSAINQFIEHPVFGGGFLLRSGFGMGFYPHNFILESFMGMGIIGGFLFISLIGLVVIKIFSLLRSNQINSWIPLATIQFIVLGMFSGGLYNALYMWPLIALVIKASKK